MEEASEIQNHDFPKFSRNGMKTRRGGMACSVFGLWTIFKKDLTTHHHNTSRLCQQLSPRSLLSLHAPTLSLLHLHHPSHYQRLVYSSCNDQLPHMS